MAREHATEIDQLNGLLAESHDALDALVIAWAMVRHESERPEWLRELMPFMRVVLAKLESR